MFADKKGRWGFGPRMRLVYPREDLLEAMYNAIHVIQSLEYTITL